MKIFIALLAFGMILIGGQALFTAITNTKPVSYEFADYVEKRPKDKWLKLQGCQLNVADCAYEKSFGSDRPEEVYIPVRPAGAQGEEQVVVLLATKDKQILSLVEEMNNATTEKEVEKFFAANAEQILVERDIAGLTRFGLEMDSGDRDDLLKLQPNLAKDFVLIDEGKRPSFLTILALPGGILAIWIFFFKIKSSAWEPVRRSNPPNVPPQVPPAGPPTLPPQIPPGTPGPS